MSSSTHFTITSSEFDMENAFSTMNIHNYISTSSATLGSTSFNSSEDSRDGMIPPTFSLSYNNPYLKDVQAFYAKESLILPPDPITPPQIYSPSSSSTTLSNSSRKQAYNLEPPSFSVYTPTPPQIFEIGKSSIKEHLKHHEKQIKDILYYLEELSFHHIEKMEERLVNGWIIIPRDFDEVKTKLKEARTQILELQKKHMGQRDKIAFVRFRISDLEMTLEDIQDRHQLYMKNLMEHTSTLTSEASAMTHATFKKLVADSVDTTLEAETATMTIINNPNKNYRPRKTLVLTESIFSRSNCAKKNNVKFAINTLIEEALFWWNSIAQSIGIEEAYKITWSEFKRLLIKKYCPQTEIKKMEEAITITQKLIKQVMKHNFRNKKPITINESLMMKETPPTTTTTPKTTTTITTPTIATTTIAIITTNSRIRDKKPSGLILPTMGILETVPYVQDAPYIT
ncbi:hypothetical protein Tco_0728627 [Tanacetum coccineum]|uniref:Reverse transcriptase domain-containing protein n=1 Tax=Tanacetum coccineum TaxID=301880 RepID=A0ABQ4YMT6_9ASTR